MASCLVRRTGGMTLYALHNPNGSALRPETAPSNASVAPKYQGAIRDAEHGRAIGLECQPERKVDSQRTSKHLTGLLARPDYETRTGGEVKRYAASSPTL